MPVSIKGEQLVPVSIKEQLVPVSRKGGQLVPVSTEEQLVAVSIEEQLVAVSRGEQLVAVSKKRRTILWPRLQANTRSCTITTFCVVSTAHVST